MPELIFKGKEFVYNHHLAVPHHPLVPHPDKSIGEARMDGNLIIQGDNLLSLKSLLPMYAGKVDCVFIDPPYNTGNEDWGYNDNVNSPLMQLVGCGDKGTASFAIDAVRELTTSYKVGNANDRSVSSSHFPKAAVEFSTMFGHKTYSLENAR